MNRVVTGIILCFLIGIRYLMAQGSAADSLTKALQTTTADTAKASTYCRLCDEYKKSGNFAQALQAGQQGIALAEQENYAPALMACRYHLGFIYAMQNDLKKALTTYRQLLQTAETVADYRQQASALHSIGNIYSMQANYPEALSAYQNSLRIAEKIGFQKGIFNTLNNIGNLYKTINNLPQALIYYQKSLQIAEKNKNQAGIVLALGNIGNIYVLERKDKEALPYFNRTLKMAESINDLEGVAFALHNIGMIYVQQHKNADAIDYLTRCLKIAEQTGDKVTQISALSNIGLILKDEKGKLAEARSYLERGLKLAEEIGHLDYIRNGHQFMAQADSMSGNYASAYRHLAIYTRVKDSLMSAEKSKEIGILETKFRYEKEKEEQALRQSQEAERRQFWAWVFGLAFMIVVLLMGLFFYRYQAKNRMNKLLSLSRERLQNAYEELNSVLDQVQHQKEDIEHKNEKIEDSIRYAYQIQSAILPDGDYLNQCLPHHYIFYQPKDIVSGDFYWVSLREDWIFFAVADCTGHGVPGAFMSVIGSNTLQYTVNELGLTDPDVILLECDRRIRRTLHQENQTESKDGMDIALCAYHAETGKLLFAGANRPLYLYQNQALHLIKGDKFPIGGGQQAIKTFTLHTIDVQAGDRIYLFTDGITDQFGGTNKKKYTPKRLQTFIWNYAYLSLAEQEERFDHEFRLWMEAYPQLDDLTLLAVEVGSRDNNLLANHSKN